MTNAIEGANRVRDSLDLRAGADNRYRAASTQIRHCAATIARATLNVDRAADSTSCVAERLMTDPHARTSVLGVQMEPPVLVRHEPGLVITSVS